MGTCQDNKEIWAVVSATSRWAIAWSLIKWIQCSGCRFPSTCKSGGLEDIELGTVQHRKLGLQGGGNEAYFERKTVTTFVIMRDRIGQRFPNPWRRHDKHFSPWDQTTASSRFPLIDTLQLKIRVQLHFQNCTVPPANTSQYFKIYM